MKLVRLALVNLGPRAEHWKAFSVTLGDVLVGAAHNFGVEGALRLLVLAELKLATLPERDGEDKIVVPATERERLESALDDAVNLVAVLAGERRTIRSPFPSLLFRIENDQDRSWLAASSGLARSTSWPVIVGGAHTIELTADVRAVLSGRSDGVALLAEALAHTHGTGTFHELLRVFERGFARSASKLADPLAAFLCASPLNHTIDEVESWCVGLRHSSTHADTRPAFLTEREILPVTSRMLTAAYDVLLNKATWRDPDSLRSDVWRPSSGSAEYDGPGIFMTTGSAAEIGLQFLDEYGRYPVDLTGRLPPLGPEFWPPIEERLEIRAEVDGLVTMISPRRTV